MLFSYKTLTHAIAGSTGSAFAMSVMYPLEIVRSRMQVEDNMQGTTVKILKEILRNEGLKALYKGMGPTVQSVCVSNFVYFYTFHGLKAMQAKDVDASASKDLVLAMVAGVINVLSTTPLWVVNTRIKLQDERSLHQYNGLFDGLKKIAKNEGLTKLWSGTVPSLILVSNPALQFMTYEAVKRRLQTIFPGIALGPLAYFFVGAFSKAVATLITYPLQIIQTKLRHGHSYQDLKSDANMVDLTSYIIRKYGAAGLYKGMESKLLQTILTAALMFAAYEKIAAFVLTILRSSRH